MSDHPDTFRSVILGLQNAPVDSGEPVLCAIEAARMYFGLYGFRSGACGSGDDPQRAAPTIVELGELIDGLHRWNLRYPKGVDTAPLRDFHRLEVRRLARLTRPGG